MSSNTPELGQHVVANTPHGQLSGQVVGLESVDMSRHGSGQPVAHVCLKVDQGDCWLWVPTSEVTT